MSITPEPRFSPGDRVAFHLSQDRDRPRLHYTGHIHKVHAPTVLGRLYEIRVDDIPGRTFGRYETDLHPVEDA